ncbi:MAG: hypothetical protein DHS80DRAFT_33118 [Piptocephalis tieghemiana]|nr:MAG: hypothetical protein DHS80DRAFT_33118 [Piptocephalis tieghemiana]
MDKILNELLDMGLAPIPRSNSVTNLRKKASYASLYRSNASLSLPTEADPDDPQWRSLFLVHFVEHASSSNDDMLFFVRPHGRDQGKDHTSDPGMLTIPGEKTSRFAPPRKAFTQPGSQKELKEKGGLQSEDAVFVRRRLLRPSPSLPTLGTEAVLWRETLYCNLVAQLHSRLTVAVCKRSTPVPHSSPSSASGAHGYRNSMTSTSKHISRRVYAMPAKTFVDRKETKWECAWPLIYYAVDDPDQEFEQLLVHEGEYLCVELSATLPSTSTSPSEADVTNEASRDKKTKGSSKGSRVTLFQGAASHAALLDVYREKSSGKRRPFRWASLTGGSSGPSTEYIMMRGPGGKGHAQVAITECRPESSDPPSPPVSSKSVSGPGGILNGLRRISLLPGGVSDSSSPPPSSSSSSPSSPSSSDPLRCRMTFVNVPWTSVMNDLFAHLRKRRAA